MSSFFNMGIEIFAIFFLFGSAICSEGYYWKSYEPRFTSRIPIDAVVGGKDANLENVYIGQMTVWGKAGMHPITISPGQVVFAPYADTQDATSATNTQNNFVTTTNQGAPVQGQGFQFWFGQPQNNGNNEKPNFGFALSNANGNGIGNEEAQATQKFVQNTIQESMRFGAPWMQFGANQNGDQGWNNNIQPSSTTPPAHNPNQENVAKFIQILCSKHPEKFQWIPTTSTSLHLVDTTTYNIVRGGIDQNYVTYIGRIKYQGNVVIGKVLTNDIDNSDMVFIFNNQEYKVKSYEILTYNNN